MRILYKPGGNGPGGVEEHVRKLKKYFDTTESEDMADIIHNHATSLSDRVDVFTLHGMFLKQDWGDTQTPANMILLDHLFRAKKVITVAEWYFPILEELGMYDAAGVFLDDKFNDYLVSQPREDVQNAIKSGFNASSLQGVKSADEEMRIRPRLNFDNILQSVTGLNR